RKRMPHRFLTSGNAHCQTSIWRPLRSARRKIGAADDDAQTGSERKPVALATRGRSRPHPRQPSLPRADIARMLTKAKADSKRARRSKREGGTSNQRSRSRNKAADRVLTLDL